MKTQTIRDVLKSRYADTLSEFKQMIKDNYLKDEKKEKRQKIYYKYKKRKKI